jgi:GTPase subunit of restriction endonuclease
MSSYNQNNLLIPLIIVLGNNGGSAKTSELIGILGSVLLPDGDDLIPYSGRKDSKFSQTVRNALAPERSPQIISEGYAEVISNEGENKYVLTKRGWEIYRNLLSVKIKKEVRSITLPFQQIFYGAPGTGKSHKIKNNENVKEANEKNLVFRTTFHPDSDYSTFVGAYKPTIKPVADKYKAVAGKDEEITYSFVPQAFLQAYVAAWNNQEENVFLVIEEINRGNCAQIFGDLFQLLDRDSEGYSEYPIMADRDLSKYLNGKDENGQDVLTNKDGIKDGKLKLPNNLYIWATMNTSDQSLFPIDSAFKRRWDWVYVPIDTAKETWYIKIGESYYNWTKFLDKVNDELLTDETAEDKHLGFYFCKATEKRDETENNPKVITAETFVGKVLFYLWNDVFKVYGIPSSIGGSKDWSYRKFYQTDGKVDMEKVAKLLEQLKITPEGSNENQAEDQ